ncbi:MAG: hypothetical protein RIT28_4825 [Pseudomonadota bacterium]|jgi:hypothetical protein
MFTSFAKSRLARRVFAVSLGGVLALTFVEGLARAMHPPPRVQLIGPLVGVELLRTPWGTTWKSHDADVNPVSCPGGAPQADDLHVVLVGSSIVHGAGLDDPQDRPGAALYRALAAKTPGRVCVEVIAVPGSTFSTQVPLARHQLAGRPKADLLIWELWYNTPNTLTDLGGLLVNSGTLAADDGGPPNPLNLPRGLHYGLFAHSMAYVQLSLGLAPTHNPQLKDPWIWFVAEGLGEARRLADEHAEALVWLAMPSLDRPFPEQAAAPAESYQRVQAALDAQNVPMWSVAALWADTPPEAVRLDPCCHYNADGAERLGALLAGPILAVVAE